MLLFVSNNVLSYCGYGRACFFFLDDAAAAVGGAAPFGNEMMKCVAGKYSDGSCTERTNGFCFSCDISHDESTDQMTCRDLMLCFAYFCRATSDDIHQQKEVR